MRAESRLRRFKLNLLRKRSVGVRSADGNA